MKLDRARVALLVTSSTVVLLMIVGAVAMKVGASEGAYRQVLTFSEVLSLVMDNYVDPVDQDRLMAGAYDGLLGGLDARGAFLTPEEVAIWKQPPPSPLGETGLVVLKGGPVALVVAVATGSPAADAGIVAGDQIRRVAGIPVRKLSHDQLLRRLKGKVGSTVHLALIHPADAFSKDEREVAFAARTDAPHTVAAERGIAILTVRDFERLSAQAVRSDLAAVRSAGTARLLVDLRNVAWGSPRDVAPLLGLFTRGTVVSLKDKLGKIVETVDAGGDGSAWPGEIAVLVNGGTAGGAEAVAVALKAARGAIIFGETSYGLGTEPRLVELPDGSALLVSAYAWEASGGRRWLADGITPDQEIRAERRTDVSSEQSDAEQLRRVIDRLLESKPATEQPKAA